MSRTTAGILKVMGLFGGVQVASIGCSLVRTKLVALWIGAAGVGLFGIFNSAVEMISVLCQVGIRQSAVRPLSSGTGGKIPGLVAMVRHLGRLLALAGATLTLIAAPWLSRVSFGDGSHTWSFMALAVAVFLNTLVETEGAVFQGLKHLRAFARASVWGFTGGLIVSVPLFWWLRINSIVPAIIAYSICTAAAAWYYHYRTRDGQGMGVEKSKEHGGTVQEVAEKRAPLTVRSTLREGRPILAFGMFMTIAYFVENLINYLFLAWLNHHAGTELVGYYQAGYTLVNRYMGLVLVALSVEFYPRLAGVAGSGRRLSVFVSNELGIVMLVIVPMGSMMIGCSQWLIELLYSREFEEALPLVVWAITGTLLRSVFWCMSFTIMARGDGTLYLVTEVVSSIIYLVLNVVCFRAWGLMGLGISYTLWFLLITLIDGYIYFRVYHLRLKGGVIWGVGASVVGLLGCSLLWQTAGAWAVLLPAVVITGGCLWQLNRIIRG